VSSVIDAALATMADRKDRLLLFWPKAPDNVYVTAALTILEGRCAGKLAHASVAIWPWRPETRWEAGRIHIDPATLNPHSRVLASDAFGKAPWVNPALALQPLATMSLSLQDLKPLPGAACQVRNPSLHEICRYWINTPQER
jgi:hypothetical protein